MRLPIKKLLFGVFVFCLMVFLLNTLLGFANLKKYDKDFIPRNSSRVFVPGEGELAQFYVTNSPYRNTINQQVFPIKKASGVTRIFVVGGSAAFAWPFTEQYGFSGYLRRVLDHFAPGKFEVVNAAGMSFGSHRVYGVLQDVVELEPDLVIVYSGNNEYVERNVIAGLKRKNGPLEGIGAVLSQTNLYRAVRLGVFTIAPSVFRQRTGPDLTDLRADIVVSRGALGRSSEIDLEVLGNLRTNLAAMRDLLLTTHTKAIFFTVPSNIIGYHPTSPPPRFANNNDAQRWEKLQQETVNTIQSKDSGTDPAAKRQILHRAQEMLLEMRRITPDDPWIFFTLGQVDMWLGEYDRAYEEFVQAKDLDARPVRELSSFNESLRAIVREQNDNQDMMLFDLEEYVAAEIQGGNADWIFLDYCHLTDAGHKFVAINVLPYIQKILGANFDLEQMSLWIFNDPAGSNKDPMTQNNVLYASGLTYIHNGQYKAAERDFLKILDSLEPDAIGLWPSTIYRALSHVYQGLGKQNKYREYLLKAIEANPENFEALISGGLLFIDEGDLAKAEELLNKAIQLNQYAPLAFEGLGRIALMKGAAQEAVSHYENALRLGGDTFLLRRDLGKAYLSLGDVAKAIGAWRVALSFDSSDREVMELLEKYSRPE